MLIRLSVPSLMPFSVDDLVERLQKWGAVDDYDRLERLIRSEVKRYEDFTGRILAPTEFEYQVDGFGDPIALPVDPVRTVSEIAYLDDDDAEQTLSASAWYTAPGLCGTEVWFVGGFSAPVLSTRVRPVRLRFSAGYDVPGVSGYGDVAAYAQIERDVENVMALIQRLYDHDEQMPDAEMRRAMSHRRVMR